MFKFDALFPNDDGSATMRFSVRDDKGEEVGSWAIKVSPTPHGTTDSLIGRGYREMATTLGKWQGRLLEMAGHYESRSAQ